MFSQAQERRLRTPGRREQILHGHGDAHVDGAAGLDIVEALGGDADDGEGQSVDFDLPADDRAVAGEPPLPAGIAQDGDGLDAEDVEVIAGGELHIDHFGGAVTEEAAAGREAGQNAVEDCIEVTEVEILGKGEGHVAAAVAIHAGVDAGAAEDDEAVGIANRQAPQNGLIERGEDESIGANA